MPIIQVGYRSTCGWVVFFLAHTTMAAGVMALMVRTRSNLSDENLFFYMAYGATGTEYNAGFGIRWYRHLTWCGSAMIVVGLITSSTIWLSEINLHDYSFAVKRRTTFLLYISMLGKICVIAICIGASVVLFFQWIVVEASTDVTPYITGYTDEKNPHIKRAMDRLQTILDCCGHNEWKDWFTYNKDWLLKLREIEVRDKSWSGDIYFQNTAAKRSKTKNKNTSNTITNSVRDQSNVQAASKSSAIADADGTADGKLDYSLEDERIIEEATNEIKNIGSSDEKTEISDEKTETSSEKTEINDEKTDTSTEEVVKADSAGTVQERKKRDDNSPSTSAEDRSTFPTHSVPFSCCSSQALRPCINEDVYNEYQLHPNYNPKTQLTINEVGCKPILKKMLRTRMGWTIVAEIVVAALEIPAFLILRMLQTSIGYAYKAGDEDEHQKLVYWFLKKPTKFEILQEMHENKDEIPDDTVMPEGLTPVKETKEKQ